MEKFTIVTIFYISFLAMINGQNTVGLVSYDPVQLVSGYNLVYPHNQSSVFLLDNCGQVVHQWEDDNDFLPGNTVYLMPDGDLIKAKRPSSFMGDAIWAGGGGATVERLSWDNNILWSFTLNDSISRLHHDIAVLPNGNVLMVAWELKSTQESIQAGRDPAKIAQDKLWPDQILEYNPNQDAIVWEWHAWDHLIQNFDNTKDNFGVVSDHPELIDINWDNHNGHPDWMHVNAIDYNEYLDQIVISVPYFDEVWIIDHSTTTEEAAESTGGDFGKGGDLLYRWGNPITYTGDTDQEQQLFFSHNINWINPQAEPTDPDFGKMAVFNNRLPNGTSSANIFLTGFDVENNEYPLSEQQIHGPSDFERVITHPGDPIQAYSNAVSGVQILPNGNALVCSGRWGFSYEINPQNEVVWEYVLPIQGGNPVEQGAELAINDNFLFRLERYSENYSAFNNRDLTPQGYLELSPNLEFCDLATSSKDLPPEKIAIYPNPVIDYLKISAPLETSSKITIYNSTGNLVIQTNWSGQPLDLRSLPSGLYFMSIDGKEQGFSKFFKL